MLNATTHECQYKKVRREKADITRGECIQSIDGFDSTTKAMPHPSLGQARGEGQHEVTKPPGVRLAPCDGAVGAWAEKDGIYLPPADVVAGKQDPRVGLRRRQGRLRLWGRYDRCRWGATRSRKESGTQGVCHTASTALRTRLWRKVPASIICCTEKAGKGTRDLPSSRNRRSIRWTASM